MALGRALMIGEAMTKSPQPLSDGYNVNSEDEEVYNWLIKFDSGETFNNDGVTQWAICELALERIKKDAQDSHESNFESATLDWVGLLKRVSRLHRKFTSQFSLETMEKFALSKKLTDGIQNSA
jgi:hypothetical protein